MADSQQQIDDQIVHQTVGSGLAAVNVDTVFVTLIACAVLLAAALVIRANIRSGRQSGFVTAVTMIVEFIDNLTKQTIGSKPIRIIGPLAICLFTFLLVSNVLGLIPSLHSPTNDVNTALALSIISVAVLHVQSVRFRGGLGYFKHYATPSPVFIPINLIEELAKPITLTFRLYFNIFVGELLLLLIVALFPLWLSPLQGVLGIVWILFSLFVSGIQAFIFTMLTISYVAMGTETGHGPAETDSHSGPSQAGAH